MIATLWRRLEGFPLYAVGCASTAVILRANCESGMVKRLL